MKIVSLPRRGGKTEALLRWMQEAPAGEHRIFVAFSREEAHRVQRLAFERNLDLESWQFVSADEARDGRAWDAVLHFRGGVIVLGFDNLDLWVQQQFPWHIDTATLNEDGR